METNNQQKMTREEYHKIKKRKRLRPWAFWLFTTFFLIAILISILILYNWGKDNQKTNKLNEEISKLVEITPIQEEGELINPPEDKKSDYWYFVEQPFYNIDFSELQRKNDDTVAFIHMENTNINYPIVQTTNNEYYLTHAFDKSYNNAGWVFMDYENLVNFQSDNTVIYGHGRLDKTVFGSLKNTLSSKWQENIENYAIWISTPNENMVYQIFSIYTIDSESYYIKTDFSSNKEKEEWLKTMKSRNTASQTADVDVNDKILTLSTCLNNNGGRIVVQAKLIKIQKRQ
ncbi:MAG: class B sortase [bacterium]|nr:class B sortase [bacterium]